MSQKDVFLNGEGDAWYNRTIKAEKGKPEQGDIWSLLKRSFSFLDMSDSEQSVLEIGCSDGRRLAEMQKILKAKYYGVDPSHKAIEAGKNLYPEISLQVGTADTLPFKEDMFNMVIFGFCLYLCDRKHLFKIAYEADRVLKSDGYLCIIDFYSSIPYNNSYKHYNGISSYKMDYSTLFRWNPAYSLVATIPSSHGGNIFHKDVDERLALHILYKNMDAWQPRDPFVEVN